MSSGKWCPDSGATNSKTPTSSYGTCWTGCIPSYWHFYPVTWTFCNSKICHLIHDVGLARPPVTVWWRPYLAERCSRRSLVWIVRRLRRNMTPFWIWVLTFHRIFCSYGRPKIVKIDKSVHSMVKIKDTPIQRQIITLFFCLSDCLQKFVDVEELAETERFFCNNCKNKQRSTKKFWIRRLPNVRFHFSR